MGRFFIGIIIISVLILLGMCRTWFPFGLLHAINAYAAARHSRSTLAAKFARPGFSGMVLANQADAQTNLTVRVEHAVSGLLFVRVKTSHLRRRAHVIGSF